MLKSKEITREGKKINWCKPKSFLGQAKSTIAGIPLLTTFLYPVTFGGTLELLEKSPCPHPLFGRAFSSRYPLFQWCPESKEILLNLSMKC